MRERPEWPKNDKRPCKEGETRKGRGQAGRESFLGWDTLACFWSIFLVKGLQVRVCFRFMA